MNDKFLLGEEEVTLKLSKVTQEIILNALDTIWICANTIADDAREIVPADTGRLRDSIIAETPQIVGTEIRCVISANTYYAIYVELGTWKMAARPYLSTALYNNKADFERKMKELIK